jgi:hypothetical protein
MYLYIYVFIYTYICKYIYINIHVRLMSELESRQQSQLAAWSSVSTSGPRDQGEGDIEVDANGDVPMSMVKLLCTPEGRRALTADLMQYRITKNQFNKDPSLLSAINISKLGSISNLSLSSQSSSSIGKPLTRGSVFKGTTHLSGSKKGLESVYKSPRNLSLSTAQSVASRYSVYLFHYFAAL